MTGKRYRDHASDQAILRGAGGGNRARTISLGMSAAGTPDQFHRRSARILMRPSITVSPPGPTGSSGTERASKRLRRQLADCFTACLDRSAHGWLVHVWSVVTGC